MAFSDQLATRIRALLRSADHPSGAAGTAVSWRADRDRWLDLLDPREPKDLGMPQIRQLIDFLSECGPSKASRRTESEWNREVDAVVPELLFVGQKGA
jgi:hypothetical protein